MCAPCYGDLKWGGVYPRMSFVAFPDLYHVGATSLTPRADLSHRVGKLGHHAAPARSVPNELLRLQHRRVDSILVFAQLFMGSLLFDSSFVNHHDLIRIFDCTQTMRDYDGGQVAPA